VDEFFQSVGTQFADNRGHAALAVILLSSLAALAALAVLFGRLRRLLRARRELRDFAARHQIAAGDLAYAASLARASRLPLLDLLQQLDLFEHATAQALAGTLGPDAPPGDAARLGRLRRALGYDQLADFMPLFSSRELPAGTEVRIGERAGETRDANESELVIELPGEAPAAVGDTVAIEIEHAREAPYHLSCALRAIAPAADAGTVRLTFAHDEMPLHLRGHEMRVAVRGPIALRPALHADPAARAEEIPAELLEASEHELLASSVLPIPAGRFVECTFALGLDRFRALRALVRTSEPGDGGTHRLHLELRGVSERDRTRLRAAIERQRPA